MKKNISLYSSLIIIFVLSVASINSRNSSGRAGNTGSPGEGTCSAGSGGCHSGGSSSVAGVTLVANPAFTNNSYIPGTVYTVSLTVGALGFSNFGFGCEALNSANTNAGTLQNAGPGVKFLVAGNGRNNAVQNSTQSGNGAYTFTFDWQAPANNTGTVRFFYCGNAVNGTGGTGGDLGLPGSLTLTEASAIGLSELDAKSVPVSIQAFPNPARDFVQISYELFSSGLMQVELINLKGERVRQLSNVLENAGTHQHFVSLKDVESGLYIVRVKTDKGLVGQTKLTVVN